MLYHDTGLLGVSGISNDMRALLASEDVRAREAVDLFVFRIAREAGALASSPGRAGRAGIHGRHRRARRTGRARASANGWRWLGVELDTEANNAHEGCISTPSTAASMSASYPPTRKR